MRHHPHNAMHYSKPQTAKTTCKYMFHAQGIDPLGLQFAEVVTNRLPLPTTIYPLPTTHYHLSTTHYHLSTTHYHLSTTNYTKRIKPSEALPFLGFCERGIRRSTATAIYADPLHEHLERAPVV